RRAVLLCVPCETRVMSGSESDVMPPDSARRFAAAIPGGVLEVVDGVGHHVELDAAEQVARRILELSESSELGRMRSGQKGSRSVTTKRSPSTRSTSLCSPVRSTGT